ncbi:uncharacterized protein LOC143616073 [Bidens hawaiensis]|uniref:uncharacterized protein LOC143616073 n=1 Tax=Bidens hawaiensis TaxID=980011 RepID=UPI00404ACE68
MKEYLRVTRGLMKDFEEAKVIHIPRGSNKKVDVLSKLAAVAFDHLAKEVKVETLQQPSVVETMVTNVETQRDSWMTPLVGYFREGKVPGDKEEERKLRIKALQYEMIEGGLYRKSYLGPSLKCIDEEEAKYVVREINKGICGMHMGAKMVVARIHAPVGRKPKSALVPVSSLWPFQKWGIDIVGAFPEGTGKAKFLVVAIDYFTKWVEAKPLRTIMSEQIKRFVWERIVCRFGLPYAIISDNGKQFANNPFQEWCLQLKIKQTFTSVAHPQANGQVERANRSVVEGIKARLGREKGSWVEELPHVLWAHRTMPKTSNGETPFSLAYGTEAMILAEIGVPTRRTLQRERGDEEDLRLNLNLAEERRDAAARREVEYKKKI